MRRALRWIGWGIAVLAGVLAVLVVTLLAGANTEPGRAVVARLAPRLTGGLVTIRGLSGRFPDRLKAVEVRLHDRDGVWARIDDLDLDWSPTRLVGGVIAVDRLAAAKIAVLRRPLPSAGGSSRSRLSLDVDALHVGRLDIAAAVTGTAASLALDGSAAVTASKEGHVALFARGIGAPGNYRLEARLGAADLDLRLAGQEPAHGLVSAIAGLPDLGPLSIDAVFAGPLSAVAGKLQSAVGMARLSAHGTLDLEHQAADLVATANAPAMTPRPGLSWQSIAFDARIRGPFARPAVSARLDVAALRAAGVSASDIAAKLEGDAGAVRLQAALAGIRTPGPRPDLLAAAPLEVAAEVQLDRPDRPIRFSLTHPLLTANGSGATAGQEHGELTLALPDLAPFSALAGLDLEGRAALDLRAEMRDGTSRLDAGGTVGVTGGTAPAPALIGGAAHLTLSAAAAGSNLTISRFQIDGRKIAVSVGGNISPENLALDWRLALPDLSSVRSTLSGGLRARGRVTGPPGDLAAVSDLSGTLGAVGNPPGPISAQVRLYGLPGKPRGHVAAEGVLLGSPLRLSLAAMRAADGGLQLTVEQADWKSAHAQGALALAAGARFPVGRLDLRMARLDDLRPLIGKPVTGAIAASLATTESGGRQRADLRLAAEDLGLAGAASGGRFELNATIVDPLTRPVIDTRVVASGRSASGIAASVAIDLAGPEDALGLEARSEIRDPKTGDVHFATAGTVDAATRVAAISRLQAVWKGEDVHLLAPARVAFGNGIVLDHLRLGLRQASIEADGRVSPTLNLTVALRNLSPDVAAAFAPGLAADGVLRGDARLTGTLERPVGRIELSAAGLRLRRGPAGALPAANLIASVDVAGTSARLDARLAVGPSATLSVRGQVSTAVSGPIDLHAVGALDLKILDPLLTASGRRATGRIALDAAVGGTLHAPRVSGTARLAAATIEDFALGVRIADITGLVQATGTTIRLTRLEGHAGPGTIGLAGTVDLSAPGIPVNFEITAQNARPLASDLLTATLNADMRLRGEALGRLALAGRVDVLHAEVGIPKSMPAEVPVLPVRVAGAPPAPPPKPPPAIGLDLTVAAHRVVVSGRGLFAELAGSIRVGGTTAAPRPVGSFHMVRGTLNLAGQTLTFTTGEVGFNGGSLSDPSLDFVVTSETATMSVSLTITGTASHPKVAVTSIPEMPSDEALGRMLYPNRSGSPSPIELAEIAASLAELSGATSGGGPLAAIQQKLGLERLSVGTAANGSAALQAGRYVAPGVFVGAQQGAGGNSTQARVEVDVVKGLKVFGTVGTGSNTTPGATPAESAGTSLGVKYSFEY
jgi:translocation and assembly module TamB